MADKIISSFQQRRQLSEDLAHLAQTTSEAQLTAGARALAHTYPADLLLATLVKHLDTTSSQLRGGLGHLAALLPPDAVTAALRGVAGGRGNSAQARFTAALIMERFLGESVPPALLADLNQSNEVAFQSLREAVEEGALDRRVLLDYVTQMRQTPESIAFMVMDLMQRLEPYQCVDLYRLLALDDRPAVARHAIQQLERIAPAVDTDVLAALTTLSNMLPPDMATLAERTLRKLQFSGLRYTPPAADGWRALLSPADMGGHISLWLIKMPRTGAHDGLILGLIMQPSQGITHAFGNDNLDRNELPPQRALGELVTVQTDRGQPASLLEIPFDVGRQLLATLQQTHFARENAEPLPGDYRLFGESIWRLAPPVIDPAIQPYLDALTAAMPSAPPDNPAGLIADAGRLMAHPALAAWTIHPGTLLHTVGAAKRNHLPRPELIRIVLQDMEQRPERNQIVTSLGNALRGQALWLTLAGDAETAASASRLAAAMSHLALSANPLLTLLLETGLRQTDAGMV